MEKFIDSDVHEINMNKIIILMRSNEFEFDLNLTLIFFLNEKIENKTILRKIKIVNAL
jgi:hypothetical protein